MSSLLYGLKPFSLWNLLRICQRQKKKSESLFVSTTTHVSVFSTNDFKSEREIELDQVPRVAERTRKKCEKKMKRAQGKSHKPDLPSLGDVENHCIEILLLHTCTALQLAKILERVQRGFLVVDEDQLVRLCGRRGHRRHRRNGRRRERVGLRGLRRVCHLRRGSCSLCSCCRSGLCGCRGSLGCLAHAVRHSQQNQKQPQKKRGKKTKRRDASHTICPCQQLKVRVCERLNLFFLKVVFFLVCVCEEGGCSRRRGQ